jgi:hypothetical protein
MTETAPITATPTITVSIPCAGGSLQMQTWPLEKHCTLDGGWSTTVFVTGHGGDCVYTYTWEDEIKGGPMSGPLTFELHQTDRFGNIIGTVGVASNGYTVTMGLFIHPPGTGN